MSTTLRHGSSPELEQSIRCLDTRDTQMATTEYIQYIEKNINTIDAGKATAKDILNIANKSMDDMCHA